MWFWDVLIFTNEIKKDSTISINTFLMTLTKLMLSVSKKKVQN